MAKLAPFAFILIAIVAFSKMSAYRTSTTEDNGHEMELEISGASENQCSHVQDDSCTLYLSWLLKRDIPKCCTFLNKVKKECQCGVIQQLHDKAQQTTGDKYSKNLLHDAAQNIPNDCKLSVKDCRITAPKV
ncbi:putative bifunctional inhibitor/plant lipid transfer protein/seed storage helical [Helianthus annuus]|nr:putative bifunctional inhibitor/plant lipid transfer protein/seed storage helical [Helianthus annuus]